jgi:ubiquinone/menaquinone biosynthesis C-methylase UbiE
MTKEKYIPALKYHWLTKLYDPILQLTMPERKFKSALLDNAQLRQGQHVLDFGCGSLTLSLMGKILYPQTTFTGVDVDQKIIQIAKAKAAAQNITIPVDQYDGITLPYKDQSFDHVITSLVFHHLTYEQKQKALYEMKRVLKSSGKIHICDFGKPKNALQRLGFYFIQFLDGFTTTSDNVKGIIPILIKKANFMNVRETGVFPSLVGTVRIFSADKTSTIL